MTRYKVSGLKREVDTGTKAKINPRTNYSFVLRVLDEMIGKANILKPEPSIEEGTYAFSTEERVDIFELNKRLAERGLELEILE